ncbi:hypothetical protein GWC77_27380 [Paraburkholderia sp. NMBU_R16]|nr:hypothetical protein [Paraburkholderia sp. NMBU_R16]
MLRLVARLGGFLARKSDDEPGAETIRKGLTKVHIPRKPCAYYAMTVTPTLLCNDMGNQLMEVRNAFRLRRWWRHYADHRVAPLRRS